LKKYKNKNKIKIITLIFINKMTEDINYVYLCGYYSSEDYRGKHTLGIYYNEKDALNKMIQLCKSNENGSTP